MSYAVNKVEVMILTKTDEILYWKLGLIDSIATMSVKDEKLFSNVTSVRKFVESIGKGFKEEFIDLDVTDFIKFYCDEEIEDSEPRKELERMIRERSNKPFKISDFKKVILNSNTEMEDPRCRIFSWVLYDLENGTVTSGEKEAEQGPNHYDDRDDCIPKSKDFMESLILE